MTRMTDKEFQVACLYLEDSQRLIAAGKLQRWDVVKWTLTVNFVLATASMTVLKAQCSLFLLSLLVAALGFILIYHYNGRVTGAREDSDKLVTYLKNNGIDVEQITGGRASYAQGASGGGAGAATRGGACASWRAVLLRPLAALKLYDLPELTGFAYAVFFVSMMPAFLACLVVWTADNADGLGGIHTRKTAAAKWSPSPLFCTPTIGRIALPIASLLLPSFIRSGSYHCRSR
jgi:hypothetical protein